MVVDSDRFTAPKSLLTDRARGRSCDHTLSAGAGRCRNEPGMVSAATIGVMTIVLLLSDSLTTEWKASRSSPAVEGLRLALGAYGSSLQPVHPDTSDSELRRYFALEIAESSAAEATRKRLATVPGVEAAYIKPAEAPP